jgi:hypothetical protein
MNADRTAAAIGNVDEKKPTFEGSIIRKKIINIITINSEPLV